MKKPKAEKPPEPTYARSNGHGLTLAQQSAVDLLAGGKNDTETAEALNLNRVTVTRWRLYSPEFRAALAGQRAAIWGASADRLRSLLPKALDALADALERADEKVSVALAVLKLAGPIPLPPSDPTEPEVYVREEVARERKRARNLRDSLDSIYGLPTQEEHERLIHERLARLAGPPEGEPALPRAEGP